MPQRAVFWPAAGILIVADLHLGKCDALRAIGTGMPAQIAAAVLEEQIARLENAVAVSGATRIVVVGDLLHAPVGLTPDMVDRFAAWRGSCAIPISLVPGNHDRRIDRVREAWRLDLTDRVLIENPFAFAHDPADHNAAGDSYLWCGHVHPTVILDSGADFLKLPCFLIGPRFALLPAFSRFTAGAPIRPAHGDRAYAIADQMVIPI